MTTWESSGAATGLIETGVIVIGGGPVGLTLAHELGTRGVATILVEPREYPDPSSPRCKQLNPRSMEHFRRLGVADEIRRHSLLPFGWSDAAVFCTSLAGHRIERFDGVFALSDVPSTELPEPAQWTAQYQVEAALRVALAGYPSVQPWWGFRLVELEQDGDGVVATVADRDGRIRRVRGQYLAGTDGARSTVRGQLGIDLSGRSDTIENLQVTFDAPDLGERHGLGRAVQYWVLNSAVSGLLGPLDTGDSWWAIVIGAPPAADREWTERALRTMVGWDVPIRVRSQDPWTARMLIADRYRHGRCFLAGDAAHLNPPWGGFGANTGIADAVDLGWKLAATVSGWAGAELLDSYQTERRPAAERTIAEAERNMAVLTPELSRPDLDGAGAEALAAREAAAAAVRRAKASETYTLGFVLGAGCSDSPLVVPDDEDRPAPVSDTSTYRPSARPGSRLPHLWLGPSDSLYDRLGAGFTLIAVAAEPAAESWRAAAQARGMPLHTLRLNRPDTYQLFGAHYLLVRPDHLVAWRGDQQPSDPGRLLDHVRGAAGHQFAARAHTDQSAEREELAL